MRMEIVTLYFFKLGDINEFTIWNLLLAYYFSDAPSYPALEEDLSCDVLVIGGGSSGAQCAYYLADTNLDVAVIEKSTNWQRQY